MSSLHAFYLLKSELSQNITVITDRWKHLHAQSSEPKHKIKASCGWPPDSIGKKWKKCNWISFNPTEMWVYDIQHTWQYLFIHYVSSYKPWVTESSRVRRQRRQTLSPATDRIFRHTTFPHHWWNFFGFHCFHCYMVGGTITHLSKTWFSQLYFLFIYFFMKSGHIQMLLKIMTLK